MLRIEVCLICRGLGVKGLKVVLVSAERKERTEREDDKYCKQFFWFLFISKIFFECLSKEKDYKKS